MRKIVLCLMALFLSLEIWAQTEDGKMVSSLIVALDVRSNVNRVWNPSSISYAMEKILSDNKVKANYVSGVIYGIREGEQKPDDFSRLIVNPQEMTNNYTNILQTLHSNLPYGTYYSITSFAKPYSLMALKEKQSTNVTYMVLITDGMYNGNDDYYGEATYVKKDFSSEGRAQFQKDIASVQTNYFCRFIDQCSISGGHLQLYEFIPLQQYFALESVLEFPHEIIAKRAKEGYSVNFSVKEVANKDYEIKRVVMYLSVGNEIKLTQELNIDQEVEINVSKEDIGQAKIGIKAWVKLNDGIYNNTVLHPEGSKLQGADGLTRESIIMKEGTATILGLVPLPDFLFKISFWTSSQSGAANTWGWILIFIILAIVVFAIYKSNIYKPNPNEIKI